MLILFSVSAGAADTAEINLGGNITFSLFYRRNINNMSKFIS